MNSCSTPSPRKWDAEIDTARQHDDWLQFEADIHQSAALRARVARSLDRFGLGTSDIAVESALDYLTHKELGASARYFNQTGKAQFNQQQITHAVLSFMALKEQQRHLTDCAIHTDEHDHDDDAPASLQLYDLLLSVREPGTLARIHRCADCHGIGQSTVYFRIQKLAQAIQRHPWFDEITSPFRPQRTAV